MFTVWYVECDVCKVILKCDVCIWYLLFDVFHVMYALWCLKYDVCSTMFGLWCLKCDVCDVTYAVWCLKYDVCVLMFAVWCLGRGVCNVVLKCDVFLWCLQFDMCVVTLATWFVVHKVIGICSQHMCVQWDAKNLFSHVFTLIETNLPEGTAISQQIFFVLNIIYYYSPIRTFVALFISSESPLWMGDQTIAKP